MSKASRNHAPAVITPSAPRPSFSQGEPSLSRYMSELAAYDLLTRDDEIALAEDVERLEVAYWSALLSFPPAFATIRPVIERQLEAPLPELGSVQRLVAKASHSKAPRSDRQRYERAARRLSEKLRALDLHRDIVKSVDVVARLVASGSAAATRGARPTRPTQSMRRYATDIEAARREQQAAKDRFVAANLRLVVSMARRYARSERMPLQDLIQEGNLGLIKAVERFDHRRGFRFSTYASWWIRHALTRGLADKGRVVRLPVHALENKARVARVMRAFASQNGVAPNLAQLVEATGLSEDKVAVATELSTDAHFSLDAPVGNDTERSFVDYLRYEDEQSVEDRIIDDGEHKNLSSLLTELSPFEAQILRFRYGFADGEERTLKEIGDMYNLSRERIRQIQAGALAKMRARMGEQVDGVHSEPAAS